MKPSNEKLKQGMWDMTKRSMKTILTEIVAPYLQNIEDQAGNHLVVVDAEDLQHIAKRLLSMKPQEKAFCTCKYPETQYDGFGYEYCIKCDEYIEV